MDNVSFNQIPLDIRTPGQFIEIDNIRATGGIPTQRRKIQVLGQRLSTGTQASQKPVRVMSGAHAAGLFGRGSQLSRMVAAAKKANTTTDMWAVALDDLESGHARGTLRVSGTPTAGGMLSLYVAGTPVRVPVAAGERNSVTWGNIASAVAADATLPVTANSNIETGVDFNANHSGECGNNIDIRLNYYDGEVLPAGLTVSFSGMSGGYGNPDINLALAALGGDQYYTIITPWTDDANMTALETFLQGRWGPMSQKTGTGFACVNNTLSGLVTYGNNRNSPMTAVLGIHDMPIEPCITAAVWGSVVEREGAIDPARGFQTLPLPGIMSPPKVSEFTRDERDILLHNGISTFIVDPSGNVLIEQVITTYQTSSSGFPDVSYLKLNTVWTVDAIRFAVRARIAQVYPRHKLADDGTNFAPGQAIATPALIRAELVGLFRELEQAGLVENFDQFKNDLLVVRSVESVNQVNAVIPPNLVNQFDVFAASIQYIL